MVKRRALGRGLDALIPQMSSQESGEAVREVDIDLIAPNPSQPRKQFNQDSLKELADSIEKKGILQPILVRRQGKGYQIIVGERRWRAAQLAGLRSVPVLQHDTSDAELLELALIENIHREDLNPLEQAKAYQMMIDQLSLTQEQVAERVGKDRSTVTNTLRLLRLHVDAKNRLIDGDISMGHARALLAIDDLYAQSEMCAEIVRLGLNVRQTEQRVRRLAKGKRPVTRPALDPFLKDAALRLSNSLQSKVNIVRSRRGGKIEIKFSSDEELQRLFERLIR